MKQTKMRKGAVMMEYVILAVMIAAAALVAIIYFGRTINQQAQTAAMATAGQSAEAKNSAAKAMGTAKAAPDQVKNYHKGDQFGDVKDTTEKKGK